MMHKKVHLQASKSSGRCKTHFSEVHNILQRVSTVEDLCELLMVSSLKYSKNENFILT